MLAANFNKSLAPAASMTSTVAAAPLARAIVPAPSRPLASPAPGGERADDQSLPTALIDDLLA